VGGALGAFLLLRLVGPRRPGARRLPVKHIAGYAGALLIVDGAFALFSQLDVLLIGAIMSATAAGLFQAPLRLVTFLHYPGLALAAGVAPRLARREGAEPEVDPFVRALRYLLMVQALLTAVAVVWAEPIVEILLGPKYAESAEVLRALGPFIFLAGIAPVISLGVNYLGEARRRVPIAIAAVAINAGIDVALIPEIGIVAGAIGTDVAFALYVPAHFWVARRIIDLPLKGLGVTLVRTLLAGGAAAGVLALFGTSADLSALEIVGGGLAALAIYPAVLLALRELTGAELRQARELLTRRLRRS
jgi:O-antigen/teichoic acid export membrane protein